MMLSITKIIGYLLLCFTLSCMVPLPKAMRHPAIPFKVVFCMGVVRLKKSSRCGVTQQDAPESIIDCVISCVKALLALSMAIFNSVLFLSFVLV
jgi:hypothetical protein